MVAHISKSTEFNIEQQVIFLKDILEKYKSQSQIFEDLLTNKKKETAKQRLQKIEKIMTEIENDHFFGREEYQQIVALVDETQEEQMILPNIAYFYGYC